MLENSQLVEKIGCEGLQRTKRAHDSVRVFNRLATRCEPPALSTVIRPSIAIPTVHAHV